MFVSLEFIKYSSELTKLAYIFLRLQIVNFFRVLHESYLDIVDLDRFFYQLINPQFKVNILYQKFYSTEFSTQRPYLKAILS
jgi:hypothetical protein